MDQYVDGANLYSSYIGLFKVDPTGMLTEREINLIMGCAGAAWEPRIGSLDGGTLNRSDCGHELIQKGFNNYTIREFGKTMEKVVESLVKALPGGAQALKAKAIKDAIKDFMKGDTQSAADEVKNKLVKELTRHLPPGVPKDSVDKLIDDLYKKKVGAAKGECVQIDLTWSSNTTKPNNSKHGMSCDLVVCGKYDAKGDLNYTVQGSCDYTCTGTPCCCGAKKSFTMSQNGKRTTSFGFGVCKHGNKKVSW